MAVGLRVAEIAFARLDHVRMDGMKGLAKHRYGLPWNLSWKPVSIIVALAGRDSISS